MIYLDNAATTKPCREAAEAVAWAMTGLWGNPSAGHAPGREARAALDKAREQVLRALGPGGEPPLADACEVSSMRMDQNLRCECGSSHASK